MLAPLLALLMTSPQAALPSLPALQAQEQKQVPKPHPEVQKLIDEATNDNLDSKDALAVLNTAMTHAIRLVDLAGEGQVASLMGRAHHQLGQVRRALTLYERALALQRKLGDGEGEAETLTYIGSAWSDLGEKQRALELNEEALQVWRKIGDKYGESATLNNIALVWADLGEYGRAIKNFEMALMTLQESSEKHWIRAVYLNNLGSIYSDVGQNRKALTFYEQALSLHRQEGNTEDAATVLGNIGALWSELGEKKRALDLFQQSLELARKANDVYCEARMLINIGEAWLSLGESRKALNLFEEALPLIRRIEYGQLEAVTLSLMGNCLSVIGEKQKALDFHEQSLQLMHAISDTRGAARTLASMGGAYSDLGDQARALECLEQSLILLRSLGDSVGEAAALYNISKAWSLLGGSAMSISWGKLAVNELQALRQDTAGISQVADQSLLRSLKAEYDSLATSLQSQGRIAEALQVQELQEASRIKEFVYRNTAEQEMFSKRLNLTKLEKHWMDEYEESAKPLGALRKKREELARIKERLPEQEKALQDVETKIKEAEVAFRKTLEAMTAAFKKTTREDNRLVDLTQDRDLTHIAKNLTARTGKKVGCFATIVGEKSTHVMFIGRNAKVVTKEVRITRSDLSKVVTEALSDMKNPSRIPYNTSKKLYDLVIKPFERELKGLDCVMFNLNGPLRYVPMAALWDGKRHLAERFQVTNFSIAVWENLAMDPPETWSAEFFGLTQKVEGFSQLPGVKAEVEDAAPLFKATPRLDDAFTKSSLESLLKMKTANLLHFGTHFVLDPASSEETYMVLGDGTKWRPTEMEQDEELSLEGVELLVAGACSTGVPTGDDASIEGFGAYCQVKGARSVLSTLWEVNDASTSSWMRSFYRLLASGKGKGEALHRAQLAMITGDMATSLKLPRGGSRGPDIPFEPGKDGFKPDPKRPYAHPFYWAPYTLSGNWR